MNPTIEVSEVDSVPEDARVCDYDELTGEATQALPDAVEHGTTTVRWRTAEQFADIDVVRFTDYYRVLITELQDAPEERTPTTLDERGVELRVATDPGRAPPEDPLPEFR